MEINKEIKFDFNDILIVAEVNTDIESRYKNINPYYNWSWNYRLPLFTAPMDTVISKDNIQTFLDNKINVVLPRTINNVTLDELNYYNSNNIFISYGLCEFKELINSNINTTYRIPKYLLLDIANGHMSKIIDLCKKVKEIKPDIQIMVGNIANPETYKWYAKNQCVDYIRCSIGSGSGCLTSENGGVGFPVASLIYEIAQIKKDLSKYYVKLPFIIADGGMKTYSDIIKALALGADAVMVGSLFNKAIESGGYNYFHGIKVNDKIANYLFDKGYTIKKHFRGMSTKGAQKAMGKNELKTSEGVTRYRNAEYHLSSWIENFEHYLRSAMSYTNSHDLNEFIGNAEFCLITDNSFKRFNK